LLWALLLAPALCLAKTDMLVDYGWDGRYRPGKWAPIYVTLRDDTARNVAVEISAAQSRGNVMHLSQQVAVGPSEATYALYLPLADPTQTTITIRDAKSGRRLLDPYPLEDPNKPNPNFFYYNYNNGQERLLIGMSGSSSTEALLRQGIQRAGENASNNQYGGTLLCGFVDGPRLPGVAAGYDAIDILLLNQPDFGRFHPEQEQAILDWVRAGGTLIVIPGVDPLPASSMLANALPAKVGENISLMIEASELVKYGLAERYKTMKGRRVEAAAGARVSSLFDNHSAQLVRKRLGFGEVVLISVDVSQLLFNTPENANAFWRPILMPSAPAEPPPPDNGSESATLSRMRVYAAQAEQQRESAAVRQTMDMLGNVPGVGTFGFSYVVIVMIGMMLIVGPIDWLILRKLQRLPWTWYTTATWITLITAGALFIGHVFRSGDLHFRTMRVVDQADDATVAQLDIFGIYSPRTDDYRVSVPADGWWGAVNDQNYYNYYGGGSRGTTDIPVAQDLEGTRPLPLRINVWNLRFMIGQTSCIAPPMLEASLKLKMAGGSSRVMGNIANKGESALSNVVIRTRDGACKLSGIIEPGRVMEVNAPLAQDQLFAQPSASGEPPTYGYGYSRGVQPASDISYPVSCDLALQRSLQIEKLLKSAESLACVYADVEKPEPRVKLQTGKPIERHWEIVRALTPLGK
jgi:hypothetical protein